MSDHYDSGYCDICDRYHENGCPRLKRAKKDSRERFRLLFKRFGLEEDFANESGAGHTLGLVTTPRLKSSAVQRLNTVRLIPSR